MDRELTKSLSGFSLWKIGNNTPYLACHGKEMAKLQPGSLRAKYPTGETPQRAITFINQFVTVKGNFPSGEFRAIRLIHSTEKQL